MSITFIHTADWQIGKPFGEFDGDKPSVLRRARLNAIDRIAEAAASRGALHVLAAGDLFDFETGSSQLVRQVVAKLGQHRGLTWHLISGNHDPARAGSVWDEVRATQPPPNVRLLLTPEASEMARGVVLLPAPLKAKASASDPTAWMDAATSPDGSIRIGLAHGSVTGFGSEGDAAVPIDPARPKRAGLAYLALGDWHGTRKISDRVWYSGTPEPDGFPDNEPGHVLAVTIDGPGAVPRVERVRTAEFTWSKRTLAVSDASDLSGLVTEVAALGAGAHHHLLQVSVTGAVQVAQHLAIERTLAELSASLFHLDADTSQLGVAARASTAEDFGNGALRAVAERLLARSGGGDGADARVAERALLKLAHLSGATAQRAQVLRAEEQ